MDKGLIKLDILFEVKDVLGRKIRTTKSYWKKIKETKHRELKYGTGEIKDVLSNPDEVRKSVTDVTILIYAKREQSYDILIVAVKVLNGDGFIVTAYQTRNYKGKGELIWPEQKK